MLIGDQCKTCAKNGKPECMINIAHDGKCKNYQKDIVAEHKKFSNDEILMEEEKK